MQMKYRFRHLLYLVLLACFLLGPSQVGIVSAELDEWFAGEMVVAPNAVQPIGTFIPIANNNTIYEYAPAVAHSGDHYMVVYSRAGEIWSHVLNNDGTYYHSFEIQPGPAYHSNPMVAYHASTGLFLVSYWHSAGNELRIRFVSQDGLAGGMDMFYDVISSDIACNQNSNTCLVALHTKKSGVDYFDGYYVSLGQGGIISSIGPYRLSNLSGRNPRLAWGKDTGTYLFGFTRILMMSNDDVFYTHVVDTPQAGDNAYTHFAKQIITEPGILINDKDVKGIAYDPCTEHYLVLFDHEFSPLVDDVWLAAVHKTDDETNWYGHVAFTGDREYGGGISFITADHLPATCGRMNKLAIIYANTNENRLYALEVKGNNNKATPVYTRDDFDDHFLVASLNTGQPVTMPAISGGSEKGEMFLVFDVIYSNPATSNVWARLVHLREPGGNIFLPLILR